MPYWLGAGGDGVMNQARLSALMMQSRIYPVAIMISQAGTRPLFIILITSRRPHRQFLHRDKKELPQISPNVGKGHANFSTASALRQDPDVILAQHRRDLETTSSPALLRRGNRPLVLSTLHTLDATETIQVLSRSSRRRSRSRFRLQLPPR